MNVSALLPSGHQMLSNRNEILITLDPVINHENNLAINRESSTRKFEALTNLFSRCADLCQLGPNSPPPRIQADT
jgi:hypothetical protein